MGNCISCANEDIIVVNDNDNDNNNSDINIKRKAFFEHNRKREIHNSTKLKLSEDLCKKAKNKILKLIEKDDDEFIYDEDEEELGENLFISYQGPVDAKTICNSWYNEKNKYDFSKNKYQKGTGHFTQMIWKESKKVGFGWDTSKNNKFYFLAYYYPAGNEIGKFNQNVLVEKKSYANSLLI